MGKSWKTSSAGLIALLTALPPVFHCFANGLDWNCLSTSLPAVVVAIGLFFAKDSQVTGGSKPQTVEAESRSGSPSNTQ